jgi:Protein of unknown function (DUF2530)
MNQLCQKPTGNVLGVVAREPDPRQPAQVDPRPVVIAGTTLWFLGFVVLLPFYDWLGRHGHRVWLWTCLAGWIVGLIGYLLLRKHRAEGRAP